MIDDTTLEKWFKFELAKLHEGIVVERKLLVDLLSEETPSARTKKSIHKFDKKVLQRFASLPDEIKNNLKMPIFLYYDPLVADSCYLTDQYGAEALKHFQEIASQLTFRNGKLWLSKPLAFELAVKYKSAIQIVIV